MLLGAAVRETIQGQFRRHRKRAKVPNQSMKEAAGALSPTIAESRHCSWALKTATGAGSVGAANSAKMPRQAEKYHRPRYEERVIGRDVRGQGCVTFGHAHYGPSTGSRNWRNNTQVMGAAGAGFSNFAFVTTGLLVNTDRLPGLPPCYQRRVAVQQPQSSDQVYTPSRSLSQHWVLHLRLQDCPDCL